MASVEPKPTRFKIVLSKSALYDRLSNKKFTLSQDPFAYLVDCYKGSSEEGVEVKSIEDEALRSEMELIVRQAKKLAVKYSRALVGKPFDSSADGGNTIETSVSQLLAMIYSEVEGKSTTNTSEFLRDFFDHECDLNAMKPIFRRLSDAMRKELREEIALRDLDQKTVKAFEYMLSFPSGYWYFVNRHNTSRKQDLSAKACLSCLSAINPIINNLNEQLPIWYKTLRGLEAASIKSRS